MGKEQPSRREETIATKNFNPFVAYKEDVVKFVHISKPQLIKLAQEAGIQLPPLTQDEIVAWGPEAQRHAAIIEQNFGISYKIAEEKGQYINAGLAILLPGKEMQLIAASGALKDTQGRSFISMMRTREGAEAKKKENQQTIEVLRKIYGDTFSQYSEHTPLPPEEEGGSL